MARKKDPVAALLKAIKDKRRDDYQFSARLDREQFQSKRRRTRASKRTLHKMWQHGLEAAGIDTEQLDALHEKDRASATKLADKHLAEARKEVKRIGKRRRQKVRQARRLKRLFEYEKGNPALLACLWEGASIEVERAIVDGNAVVVDDGGIIQHGNNKVQVLLQCDGDEFLSVNIHHNFVWTPSRSGSLTAHAWLNLNGVFDLRADGHCSLMSHLASLVVRTLMTVSQREADSAALLQVTTPIDLLVNEQVEAGCTSDTRTGILLNVDELLLSNGTPFPVEEDADRPLAVTVTTQFIMYSLGDSPEPLVRVDLNDSSEFGAVVPSVWLHVGD